MPTVVNLPPLSASGLAVHNPAPPPIHNNLPHFDHNAFTRLICTQSRRALENVWACLKIAWAKLQSICNATRRKFALSTWLAISISIIVGGLGLRYAYLQAVLGNKTLRLAEWTARKDFWELCREQKASNNATSTECELALRTHFPDPPYVDLDRRSWKQPNPSTVYEVPDLELAQNYNARLTHGVLLSALAAVLLLRNYHRIRRLANTMLRGFALHKSRTMNRGQGSYHAEDFSGTIAVSQMSTGSEMAPTENLRLRGWKKPVIILQDGKAVEAGNVKDIGRERSSFECPLSTATHYRKGDFANLLISKSADVQSHTDIFTEAASHAVAEGGYGAIVAALLNGGANVDAKAGGISPIVPAAARKYRSGIQFLPERGASTGLLSFFSPERLQTFFFSVLYCSPNADLVMPKDLEADFVE
ncbi:hypothetical protein JMJ35_003932 [Cladonia borealis]|uniref:Ankyrin repeat protein n=1 Tax=Cladonia borealis TaxID=184061 RepID=A0AA39V2K3_9LECA|nr:hypothetical protein JMJ35_003932 [Cladonia borealis]